jgi:hypothetical protein
MKNRGLKVKLHALMYLKDKLWRYVVRKRIGDKKGPNRSQHVTLLAEPFWKTSGNRRINTVTFLLMKANSGRRVGHSSSQVRPTQKA